MKHNNWKVRIADLNDLDVLCSFSLLIAKETENKNVDDSLVKLGIESVLKDSKKGITFVACDKDKVIGCFMINGKEWSEWRNGFILWLTGTYTHPDYRRMGVRKVLYEHAKNWARSQPDVKGIRGYRHKSNNAIHSAAITGGMQETEYRINEIMF